MSQDLKFKVSAALKDIIGKDLITDDFIAVFELVKNSFDAHATSVNIRFENIYGENPKILLIDNGKGMNYEDLINKWLFVAYSAKREGSEDEEIDYRDSIHQNRPFAGAKGIGRFSCDRLGRHLYLETTKKAKAAKTQILITDWEKFEGDLKEEFINVSVLHDTADQSEYGLSHGTALEISDLRSEWDRQKLLKLKDSLAKLINPIQEGEEHNFKIIIDVPEEIENDQEMTDERFQVNGEVKNFIFETLGLKTTKIVAEISEIGEHQITELKDGGTLIYRIKEKNSFRLLNNIRIRLFYLNQSAKLTFARRMGLSSRAYGHVFLYKNGFRIYPFGEPFEDPLKIDVRKSRKRYSYLGTGELMGQIEIIGVNEELKETSSRGDGLIKNKTYDQLEEYFFTVLERLEKYAVDVQKWGLSIEEDLDELDEQGLKGRIGELIADLTDAEDIVEVKYGDDFLDILRETQEESTVAVINNLKRIANESGDEKLISEAKKTETRLNELKAAKEEAEKEAREEKKLAKRAREELEEKESENLFLKSVKSQDFEEVISFLHHIGISSKNIDNHLKLLVKKIRKGIAISNEELVDTLQKVLFENRKVLSISKFASKANFKLFTSIIEVDIIEYITEYIKNILGLVPTQKPRIHISPPINAAKFTKELKPIELNIIIDNLLSNSRRANASNIYVGFTVNKDQLEISFADDGKGIDSNISKKIFDFGFTTTAGSGIGLYHIKKLLNDQGDDIEFINSNNKMTKFLITINNN